MSRPLFRDEVLQAQRGAWLGRVQLVRPLSLDLLTLGVLAVALAVGTFLVTAKYTRKATADGALVPDRGLIRLLPAEAATVIERRVTEGQAVRTGETLFVLALDRPRPPLLARGDQGGIARDLAALSREVAEQDSERRLIVRAPQDGIVSAVLAEPGQSVSPASALASLLPKGAVLQAQLHAPSSAVGFVRPGQKVRLRLEAFPYQKFGPLEGQVLQVSHAPLAAGELASQALAGSPPGRAGEAMFRITVALDEAAAANWPQPLVAGMRLQADVLLEKRRLIEWLFAPLFGLQKRL